MSSPAGGGGGAAAPPLCPLEMRGVSVLARAGTLLDIPHLVIGPERRTVIMGANGAGKSLLLRLAHGLIRPTTGTISWNGGDVDAVRGRQAFVAQRPVLLRRSAAANILFALDGGMSAAEKAARAAEALRMARLERQADTPARLLSGGEQQRLALARALARRPEVLLLDEPTASLDPDTADWVRGYLETYQRATGASILLASHNMAEVERLCDEVLMKAGRIVDRGAPEALLARYGRQDLEEVFLDIARNRAAAAQ